MAAATNYTPMESAMNTYGQGLLTVADVEAVYELVNVQQKSIYLNGCDLTKTVSHSYFSVPMVSMIITKLT